MEPDPARPELALGFDVLASDRLRQKIIGGGERISGYDLLIRRLRENNLPEETPSSGISTCGATAACRMLASAWALERTVAWICGTEHIREVIPFPPCDLSGLSLASPSRPSSGGEKIAKLACRKNPHHRSADGPRSEPPGVDMGRRRCAL